MAEGAKDTLRTYGKSVEASRYYCQTFIVRIARVVLTERGGVSGDVPLAYCRPSSSAACPPFVSVFG